jgi:hypothetical protein
MSSNFTETPESIRHQINELNLQYQEELNKHFELSVRKEIRVKIRELSAMLENLLTKSN